MIAVVQRVSSCTVLADASPSGAIGRGLLVLLGVAKGDDRDKADALLAKIIALRIFPDEAGKMNRSLTDVAGALCIVSQFTLLADTSRGRRPSFEKAAPPAEAKDLYEYVVERARLVVSHVATGVFGAHMDVSLCNEGPVTVVMEV